MPVFLIVEQADHHGIGNNHTGCIRLGTEQSQRMSGLDHECLLARQYFEILLDQAILHPVLANLPGFAIRDQFVWIESDIETEIVVDHHLESLSLQTFALYIGRQAWLSSLLPADNGISKCGRESSTLP